MPRNITAPVASVLMLAGVASAAAHTWTIDPAQSQLTVTGGSVTVSIFNFPVIATAAGSLTAPLEGHIDADLIEEADTTIQLLASSSIIAVDHGSYLPGLPGSPTTPAPGSYAGRFNTVPFTPTNVMFVTRGVEMSVEDEVRTITGGSFEADGEVLSVVQGTVDVNVDPFQVDLGGAGTTENGTQGAGSLLRDGNIETLTIPVDFELELGLGAAQLHLEFSGVIVATRDLAPACPGDVANGDGTVDVDDLNAILANWLVNVEVGSPLDLAGGDGVVNVDDLNVILANWLATCD